MSYSMQLYFDFSGYSDMAVALGLIFDKNLPLNFDSPYKSLSIIDFWRRWHISLGTWVKNYIYIPLGGSREGEMKKIRNVILAMLFTGLWHGLGLTFIIWGAIHGFMLAINHQWRRLGIKIPKFLAWLITFICIVVCWVIFRADSFGNAFKIIESMFDFSNVAISAKFSTRVAFLKNYGFSFAKVIISDRELRSIILATLVALLLPNSTQLMKRFKPGIIWLIFTLTLALMSLMQFSDVADFLYFKF